MADNAPYLRSGKYINRLSTFLRAVYYFFWGGEGWEGLLCFVVFWLCFVFLFFSKKNCEILQEGHRGLETSELP